MVFFSAIAEIIKDLLIFVVAMFALLITLIVVVSKMPDDNPLTALSYRVGATVAAGAIAIPIEPIPGLDILYDVGIPVALLL